MDPILVESFNYTVYHRRKHAEKTQGKTRAEMLLERKIITLHDKLRETKQSVVKHVLQARLLQRSLDQAEIIDRSLQSDMKSREKTGISRHLGESVLWLDDKSDDFLAIEGVLLGNRGVVLRLLYAINTYDDTKLKSELCALPSFEGVQLSGAMFSRVVVAASSAALNAGDARSIFASSESVIAKSQANRLNKIQPHWNLLVSMLRKRMLILHLALSIANLKEKSDFANIDTAFIKTGRLHSLSTEDLPEIKRPGSYAFNSPNKSKRLGNSLGSALVKRDTPESRLGRISKGARAVMTGPSSPMKSTAGVLQLRDKLQQSQARLAGFSDKIIADISTISQTVALGTNDSSAQQFAKRVGVRRMAAVFEVAFVRAVREAWGRWRSAIRVWRAEETSKIFMRAFGAVRFYRAVNSAFENKLARAVARMKYFVSWLSANESYAALVEIQRYWRGSVCRVRTHKLRMNRAATNIQRVFRGYLTKAVVIERKVIIARKEAAVKIATSWKEQKWWRITKQLNKVKFQASMVLKIQRIYRGSIARKRGRAKKKRRLARASATRIQSVWRMYRAMLRVDALRDQRRRRVSAIAIQRLVRGMIARIQFAERSERMQAATTIQYAWLCYKARKELTRRFCTRAAIVMQRVVRGRLGRLRYLRFDLMRNKRRHRVKMALVVIGTVIKGYRVRRKYRRIITAYTAKRTAAANVIKKVLMAIQLGILARKKVHLLREMKKRQFEKQLLERKRELVRGRCALLVQRVVRGHQERLRFAQARKEHEVEKRRQLQRAKEPAYYRMKLEYIKNQNMFHKKFAIRIQRHFRGRRARIRVRSLRRLRAAEAIQRFWRRVVEVQEAVEHLKRLKKLQKVKVAATVKMQSVVRGYIDRVEYRKHQSASQVIWLLLEVKKQGLIGRALVNFRLRKLALARANEAAVKIQALIRRYLTRVRFHKSYKRLLREKLLREKGKRDLAATRVQCLFRVVLAKKIVRTRRIAFLEEKKTQEMLDDLEKKLDGVHSSFLTDLMALRAQTGARGLLAKKAFLKKSAALVVEVQEKEKKKLHTSATKIQALVRGVFGRRKYKRILPILRKEAQRRGFCVECEESIATRRCSDCKDRYCENCFKILHKKGARKMHSWQPINVASKDQQQVKANKVRSTYDDDGDMDDPRSRPQSRANRPGQTAGTSRAKPVVKNTDWEEFYDPSAKAKYWYNNKTGEASWINPFL